MLTPIEKANMTYKYYHRTTGMALSTTQIPLQKSESDPTRTSISFSTSFRFTIEPSDPNYRGDGMAFVMLSEGRQGSYGGAFGVFDPRGHQIARTLAIEFDTFENSEFGDENNNHVGVDIQDINSTIARSAWEVSIDLAGSYSIYSWIDYNSSAQKLEVRISSDYAKPSLPFIVFALNLFDVFHPDELVYVGFSAANGICECFNFYTVHDWTFSYVSEPDAIIQVSPPILPAPTPEPGGEFKVLVALIAGVSLGVVLLFSILVIVGLVIRQKKSYRPEGRDRPAFSLDGVDLGFSLEFSFEQLCIATDQFGEESKLGQGAFGAVYRGQLPDTGQLVAVKRLNPVSNQGLKGFMAEVSIISQIRHRNIVKLLGWCNDRGNLLLVDPLLRGRVEFGRARSGVGASGILLGHRVSSDGIAVDVEKVKIILELQPPTNLRELRAFLGHVGYYRRFINMYAILAADLTKLLKKDEPYQWGEKQQLAFEALKAKLTTAPVLRSPDWNRPFHVYVDTSAFAIGVVLSQKDDNKKDYPIYFASRQLSAAEKKYTTTEREALGMVYSCKKFRHYLICYEFVFHVDHYALQHLVKKADLSGRIARWVLLLQEFTYTVQTRKGVHHENADYLCGNPLLVFMRNLKYFLENYTAAAV
ncbi:hypothetical protein AXG93_2834s1470 [Marchantia polymorpha subsp. ruderalis]|uniref:Protein kinase domain-containing protein n=1 Tax=Marchantia polymorpha subsp. ruderalis TaxID=1480154 RepID=A0A176WIA8_MARPO|nr:hypothetical protein AXG93_2834s1470 [Marchantia polymorpha subsp. ruderalis]